MRPEDHLEAAIEEIEEARKQMGRTDPDREYEIRGSNRPDREAALARGHFLIAGVLRDLEEAEWQ